MYKYKKKTSSWFNLILLFSYLFFAGVIVYYYKNHTFPPILKLNVTRLLYFHCIYSSYLCNFFFRSNFSYIQVLLYTQYYQLEHLKDQQNSVLLAKFARMQVEWLSDAIRYAKSVGVFDGQRQRTESGAYFWRVVKLPTAQNRFLCAQDKWMEMINFVELIWFRVSAPDSSLTNCRPINHIHPPRTYKIQKSLDMRSGGTVIFGLLGHTFLRGYTFVVSDHSSVHGARNLCQRNRMTIVGCLILC